ncbi:MAG: NADH-quinone oxidoreductase subunit C, partial [Streptosporangiaceae bacterium]
MTTVRPGLPAPLTGLLSLPGTSRFAAGGNAVTVHVPPGQLQTAVGHLASGGARLADMFADGSNPVTVRMVWALDTEQRYLITETALDSGEYPALSDIAPAAFLEECEMYEQFGIRPAGGKPLNRVAVPPHVPGDVPQAPGNGQARLTIPRLGQPPAGEAAEVRAPHTVGGQAFEFPFGPVRGAGVESLYYGLVTSGEEVVDLYLFTWHKHRGVEWRLRGRTMPGAVFLAERAEGLSAV